MHVDAGPLRHSYRRGRSVLPINAGVGGMIPLIIMAILAFGGTFSRTVV